MHYFFRNWNVVLCTWAIVALGGIGPGQRSVRAQNSVEGWPDQDFKVVKPEVIPFNTRATVLKNGTFEDASEEQKFTDYYNRSLFPNVTNPANRQSPRDDMLAKLRNDLRACEKASNPQVFDKLTDLTLDYMTKVAADSNFHPAARVNAMLAIGEVSSPKAAKVLLDTAFGRGQIYALRVAAMTGLVRMAGPSGRGALNAPAIAPLVNKNMVALVKFTGKKKDDGLYWMRGQAADVLADLGNAGAAPDLLIMLNDKDLPVPLRSKAARALGKLNYGGSPPAAGQYLAALTDFADDALVPDLPADRGRVRLIARDVLDGLKPFAASTLSSDQASIDGLQKALQTLNKDTTEKMSAEELKTAIAKAKESLDSLVKNKR